MLKRIHIKIYGTNNFHLIYPEDPLSIISNGTSVKLYDINTSNYDENAITAALNNLFLYRPGQAILEPEFGNTLYMYLYDTMNKYTGDKIVRTIRQMISRWEPRIEILDIQVTGVEDEGVYYIKILYYIPGLGIESEYSLNLSQGN